MNPGELPGLPVREAAADRAVTSLGHYRRQVNLAEMKEPQ
jgi:hypothetical protein